MKTAKEMFEKLGYECIVDSNYEITFQHGNRYTHNGIQIVFDLDLERVRIVYLMQRDRFFDSREIKAINKMVDELEWYED